MAGAIKPSAEARNANPEHFDKGYDYAAGLAKQGWEDSPILAQADRFKARGKTDFAAGMTHYILRRKVARVEASEPVVFGGPPVTRMEGFMLTQPPAPQYRCITPSEADWVAQKALTPRMRDALPELQGRLATIIVEAANQYADHSEKDIKAAIKAEIDDLTLRMSKVAVLPQTEEEIVDRLKTSPRYGEEHEPSIETGRVLIQSHDDADIFRFYCPVEASEPASANPIDIVNWVFVSENAMPEAEAFFEYMRVDKAPDNYGEWGDAYSTEIADVIEGFWDDRWNPDVHEIATKLIERKVFLSGRGYHHTLLPEADPIKPALVMRTPQAVASFYDRKATDWLSGRQQWKGPDKWDTEQERSAESIADEYRTMGSNALGQPKRIFIDDPLAFEKLSEIEGEDWAKREEANASDPNTFFDAKDAFKILVDDQLVGEMTTDEATGKKRPIQIGDITGSAGFIGAGDEIYIVTPYGEVVILGDTLPSAAVADELSKRIRIIGEPPKSSRRSSRKSSKRSSRKSRETPYGSDVSSPSLEGMQVMVDGNRRALAVKYDVSGFEEGGYPRYIVLFEGESKYTPIFPTSRVTPAGSAKEVLSPSSKRSSKRSSRKSSRRKSSKRNEPRSKELPDWTVGVRPEGAYSSEKFYKMASDIVGMAHGLMMKEPFRRIYLYYRPSTEDQWGELLLSGYDTPPGATVVTNTHLPSNKTKEQLYAWVLPMLQRLPLAPHGR